MAKQDTHPSSYGWFLILMAFIIVFFLAEKIQEYRQWSVFFREGQRAEATVLFKEAGRDDHVGYVTYSYMVQDHRYTSKEWVSYGSLFEDLEIKTAAPIYYLPAQPDESILIGNFLTTNYFYSLWLLPLSLLGWGICLLNPGERWRIIWLDKLCMNGQWAFGYLLLLLVLWVVFPPGDDSAYTPFMRLIPVGIGVLLAVMGLSQIIPRYRNSLGAKTRRSTVSLLTPEMEVPEGRFNFEAQLEALGFQRKGILHTESPLWSGDDWLYHNPDYTITAGFYVGERELAGFSSYFGEDVVLLSRYPIGENIKEPHYRVQFTEESLEAAFQLHLQGMAEMQLEHGSPHAMTSLSQQLHWDALYREKYILREFRRLLNIFRLNMLFFIYLALFGGGLSLVYPSLSERQAQAYLIVGMLILFILVRLPMWVYHHKRTHFKYLYPPLETPPQEDEDYIFEESLDED